MNDNVTHIVEEISAYAVLDTAGHEAYRARLLHELLGGE